MYDVFLAWHLAERGEETHLYTSRNSLGDDLTQTLRPWLLAGAEGAVPVFLADLTTSLPLDGPSGDPVFFNPLDLKVLLYRRLKEKGVRFHFLHTPCGINGEGRALFYSASRLFSVEGIPGGTAFLHKGGASDSGELTVEYFRASRERGSGGPGWSCAGDREERSYVTLPLSREDYNSGKAYGEILPALMERIRRESGMVNPVPSRLGNALFPLSGSPWHMKENRLSELVRIWELAALHAAGPLPGTEAPWPEDWTALEPEGHFPVIVAGCGTAGAAALIGAAEGLGGRGVLGIEGNSLPGGTGTVGGINRYYYGNNCGMTVNIDDRVKELSDRISAVHPGDAIRPGEFQARPWNIPAKGLALHGMAAEKGATILYDSRIAGLDLGKEGGALKVESVLVFTPEGPRRYTCDALLDMTGSGDAAVMAGVPSVTGSARGGNIQTHNVCRWKRDEKGFIGVNDNPGALDPDSPEDISRACEVALGDGDTYDFADYVTPREARHLTGDYTYTLDDLFAGRVFPDTIALSQTDFDQHGFQESRQARIGLLPYHDKTYRAALPLRSCLNARVANLLFGGKAVSAERDASSFFRMQADVQNIGYVLGRLAGDGTAFDREKRAGLGLRLAEEGLLPLSREELSRGRLDHIPEEAPELTRRYTLAELEEELDALIMRRKAGEEDQGELDANGRPQGGVKGKEASLFWKLNRVVWLLGEKAREETLSPAAVELLAALLEDTGPGPERATNPWVHWRRVINYDRIYNLAVAAGRIGSEKFLPGLEKWLDDPRLSGFCRREGLDGDRNYASALLELTIARTARSLGSAKGERRMAEYAGDVRSILRKMAAVP